MNDRKPLTAASRLAGLTLAAALTASMLLGIDALAQAQVAGAPQLAQQSEAAPRG